MPSVRPNRGDTEVRVNPSLVFFSYAKIRPVFSGCGRAVAATLADIVAGRLNPHDLPSIAVIRGPRPTTRQAETTAEGDNEDDDSSRGRRAGPKKKRGGRQGLAASKEEAVYFSMNNRRVWVLKRCVEQGLLGGGGMVAARLRPDTVALKLLEKGSRTFRLDRCTLTAEFLSEGEAARDDAAEEALDASE